MTPPRQGDETGVAVGITPSPAFPATLIRASAGAGKTYQLSNRYLGLIADGEQAPGILATTFTRKAAGEILGRVLTRLAHAALDPVACARLADDLGDPTLSCDRAGRLLGVVVSDLHRLRVCTLDSFFGDLAGAFGPELGLPPGWTMAEEEDTARLRVEAIDLALREQALPGLVELMRVLGGGLLGRRVVGTFDEIVKDLHEVFTEAPPTAWEPIELGKSLDDAALSSAIAAIEADKTTHKSVVKARALVVDLARAREWEALLQNGLLQKASRAETYYGKRFDPPVEAAAARIYEHAQSVLLEILGARTRVSHHLLSAFDRHFRALQVTRSLLRFEDVTRGVASGQLAELLERVAYRLDGGIGHLLLDEFQDTSMPQWRALRPFADDVSRVGEGRRSLLVVGDAKQAIYGWRGGVAEIFDAVATALPGVGERLLDRSFRSSQVVIDAVNRVFDGLARNPALSDYQNAAAEWSKAFHEHTTVRTGWAGYVRMVEGPAADDGASAEDALLGFAADEIGRLAAEAPGCSVGVLVRRNDVVASLVNLLRQRGVAASGEGGAPLTDSPAVRAVLALLNLADHPGNSIARFHVARSPLGAVLELKGHDEGSAWPLSLKVRRALQTRGYGPVLFEWTQKLAPHCDALDLRRLLQLVELGYRYEERATLRPSDFVTHVEGQKVLEVANAAVRVMTYHQAKGLEFDVVVLPELDAKILAHAPTVLVERASPLAPITRVSLPGNAELRRGTALEAMHRAAQERVVRESLSVLYVALTRAVHALHMIVAPPGKKPDALPLTFTGVLKGALAGDATAVAGVTRYEHGDRAWFERRGRPSVETAAPAVAAAPLASLVMKASTRPRQKERQSPSSLEGGGARTLGESLASTQQGALDRGTLIHRFFELIEWLESGEPARARLEAVAREQGFHAAEATACIGAFERMLREPVVRAAMSRSGYAVTGTEVLRARREMAFRVRDGEGVLDGAIDRLVLWQEEGRTVSAEVLDFKTDAVTASDVAALAQKVAFYRPQMEAYRRAVSTLEKLPLDRVGARLLFVSAGIVVSV